MKKVLNILIALVLVVMTALLVVVVVKNKEIKDKYYEAMDNCISATDKATEYENMYNSMLESFTSESAAKVEIENDYKELEEKYDILLADYEELKTLTENQEIEYEEPGTIEDYDIVTYDILYENSADYEGKLVCISGVATSLTTEDGMTLLRISTGNNNDNFVDFIYDENNIDTEVPINSTVILYGLYNGLYVENIPLILGVYIFVN